MKWKSVWEWAYLINISASDVDSDDDDDLEAIESLEAPPSAAQRVTYVRDFLDGEFKTYDDMENALRSLPQVIRHQVWSLSQFMSLGFALQIREFVIKIFV